MQRQLSRFATGLLTAAGGLIHLRLWASGYRYVNHIDLAMLANFATAGLVAVALATVDRWQVHLAAAGIAAGSLVSFSLSRTHLGLLGFHERGWQPSPEAALAIVLEVAAGLAAAALLLTSERFVARSTSSHI